MVALTLLLVLQEIHVIIVKHEASGDAAGSYAVAAVAAKAIVWVAIGARACTCCPSRRGAARRAWMRARSCSAHSR